MSKFYGLGVDPGLASAGLARVCYDEDTKLFTLDAFREFQTSSRQPLGERAYLLMTAIDDLSNGCSAMACEGISANSTTNAYSLGVAHGLATLIARNRGIPIYKVAPTCLKKFATGKGQASKEKIRKNLIQEFEHIDFSQIEKSDAVDATVLGIISLSCLLGLEWPTRAKMEVTMTTPEYHNFNTKNTKV